MTASEPATLLAAARAGDATARERLVTIHLDTVRAVCGKRLRSPHDVADATQETFARALSSLDQVRDPESLDAWLRAIAARVCADQGRQRLRSVAVADPLGDTACADPGPSELLLADEEAARLHATLATLGTRDRQALWLRDAIGLPVAHVAADLGVTEGSARVLLARARERLRLAYDGVAGVAAVCLLRVRGRLGPVDPRAALAAQLSIVALAVGVAVPRADAPVEPPVDVLEPAAPSSATRTPPVLATPSAHDADADGDAVRDVVDADGDGGTPTQVREGGDDGPPPVVGIAADEPAPPSRIGVAANDGNGDVAGVELWGGPLTGDGDGSDPGEPGGLPLGPVELVPGQLVAGD